MVTITLALTIDITFIDIQKDMIYYYHIYLLPEKYDILMDTHKNRVRNTFTLEQSVADALKHLIKSMERSEYVNNLLKEDLQKRAVINLNNRIDSLKKLKTKQSSIDVLREFRQDSRYGRIITNHAKKNDQ